MVTYRALELGAGTLEIGLITSAFSILPVLAAVAVGRWVDRLGETWFLVVAMAMIAGGSLVLATATALPALGVGNAITGFGQIIGLVAGQAMVGNRVPSEQRDDRYAWYSTAASLGQLLGPAVAGALVGGAFIGAVPETSGGGSAGSAVAPVFLFGMTGGLTACALALTLPRLRPNHGGSAVDHQAAGIVASTQRVLRRPGMPSAMVVSISVILAVDVLTAYLPLQGEAHGIPVQTIALMLSVRAGFSLISRLFMVRLIRRLGRERLLFISIGSAALTIAALPFVSSTPFLFVIMAILGLSLGFGQPMTMSWISDRSSESDRALALSIRLTGNRAALLVVPTIMGAIAGVAGVAAIWLVLGSFLAAGANVARRAPFDKSPNRRR
jgi:MFS family permease